MNTQVPGEVPRYYVFTLIFMARYQFPKRRSMSIGKGDAWISATKDVLSAVIACNKGEIKARTAIGQLLADHPCLKLDVRSGAHPLSALIPQYISEVMAAKVRT